MSRKGIPNKPKIDDPKAFVDRVEAMLKKNSKIENLERLACRFLTNTKHPQIALGTWQKLIAYRYGDPKQSSETTHKLQVELSVSDADALIRSYFVATSGEADRASEGDQMQAAQQDRKLLPS